MDPTAEPMSLKPQESLHLERIETPKGLDRQVRRQPSSDTSSEDNQAQNRVARRLDPHLDTVKENLDTVSTRNPRQSVSLTSNLPSLLKSVASLAGSRGIPIQSVWQDVRGYAQEQLLQRLIEMTERYENKKSPGFVYKGGSVGMCYLKPTESAQRGCASYERLPPVTIRPILDSISSASDSNSQATQRFSEQLMSGKTATSVIPSLSSDENVIKRYLLKPKKRHRILQLHQGSLMAGEDLSKLFRKAGDKGFICFHFKLDRDQSGTGDLLLTALPKSKASLVASNAQLVITVKRGVGGTAGMKREARLLDKGALLGLILGEDPESLLKYYAALSKIENDPSGSNDMLVEDEELLEDKPVAAEKKLSLHSLCCRVDLYLDQKMWATLSEQEVAELMVATRRFGEHFSEMMGEQNWDRLLSHLRVVRGAIEKDVGEKDDSRFESDLDDDDVGNKDSQCDSPTDGDRAAIQEQIDALLEEAMGTLHTKDQSQASLGQQSFLKMHVSCLALAASHKHTSAHGHSSHVMPMYMVSTRDCFSSDIVGEESWMVTDMGRKFVKTRWFIQSAEAPANFDTIIEGLCTNEVVGAGSNGGDGDNGLKQGVPTVSGGPEAQKDGAGGDNASNKAKEIQEVQVLRDTAEGMVRLLMDGMLSTVVHATEVSKDLDIDCAENYLLPLGVTTYNGLYHPEELGDIESRCDVLHQQSIEGILPKECYHETSTKTGSLKRTKYFFGSRYLWSREQLKSPHAKIAGGIRRDVPKPPAWMKDKVEQPLVSADVAPEGFVDAIALNMYHDGSEGIQSHYDDAKRFQQPIYSLRLFSDSRLSFGTQLYGFTNGLFFIPMPRGCVTVMENSGYAANGVKHCVRPIDMTGKSAAMILRKINTDALDIAENLFWQEVRDKLSSLSLDPTSPEDLIWNPLFTSDAKMDRETSLLMQKYRNEKKEEKAIRSLVKSMIKEVSTREKRRQTRKRKLIDIMSGMVKRVCTAEALGIDLCGSVESMVVEGSPSPPGYTSPDEQDQTDTSAVFDVTVCGTIRAAKRSRVSRIPEVSSNEALNLFNLMDDMISFVEHPAFALKRKR